MNNKKIEPRRL